MQSDLAAVALEEEDSGGQRELLEIGSVLLEQVEEADALGRMVINFSELLAGSQSHDVIARDGDQLFIPRTRQEVSIIGEVNQPTSHLFK